MGVCEGDGEASGEMETERKRQTGIKRNSLQKFKEDKSERAVSCAEKRKSSISKPGRSLIHNEVPLSLFHRGGCAGCPGNFSQAPVRRHIAV